MEGKKRTRYRRESIGKSGFNQNRGDVWELVLGVVLPSAGPNMVPD